MSFNFDPEFDTMPLCERKLRIAVLRGYIVPEPNAPWKSTRKHAPSPTGAKAINRAKRKAKVLRCVRSHRDGILQIDLFKALRMSPPSIRDYARELVDEGKLRIEPVTKFTRNGGVRMLRYYAEAN